MSFDSRSFRRALGHFATGITVVTAWHEGRVHGMTANSFTSVSLEPPLVLVCIGKQNRTHDLVIDAGRFAVNVLGEEHEDISRHYATSGYKEVPAGVDFTGDGTHSPVMAGALAWFDCSVWRVYDGGDHSIVVGLVESLGTGDPEGKPLLFFKGRYERLP